VKIVNSFIGIEVVIKAKVIKDVPQLKTMAHADPKNESVSVY